MALRLPCRIRLPGRHFERVLDPESVEHHRARQMQHRTDARGGIAHAALIGLGDDLTRADEGKNIRAGKGKMRGRRRRTPRSILLVVAQRDALAKAARNVPGVDVVVAKDLCAEDLAPGGDAGRLTVWTKAAIGALE